MISRAYYPDPSANSWVIRVEFAGGVGPYTLLYARTNGGAILGQFPITDPPFWSAFVNCDLQPGSTAHDPRRIQAGGQWWVVVRDGTGQTSPFRVVEGTPSALHPTCQ